MDKSYAYNPDARPILDEWLRPCDGDELAALKHQTRLLIESLEAEVVEWLDMAMRSEAVLAKGPPREGWWDSCALSQVCAIGDRLVELGRWERHPEGYGRHWFYRPIAAKEGGE